MKTPETIGSEPDLAASSHDLSEGWAEARLADVIQPVANVRPEDQPDREFGYVDISSIDNKSFRIKEAKRFLGKDAPSRAKRPIQAGDVLFSNVRTYLRNIAMVPAGFDADLCSTGFTVLRPNAAVDPRFLFRYLLTDDFIDRITTRQTGTHYPATTDAAVLNEIIPIPPLREQKRIATQVDGLLGRLSVSYERLGNVLAILKRFRQSVLAAACSGRLTEDWRVQQVFDESSLSLVERITRAHIRLGLGNGGKSASPGEDVQDLNVDDVPSSWSLIDLMWLCEPGRPITYGILKPGPDVADGVPYVRVADFPQGVINLSTIRRTTAEIASQYRRSSLLAGDVLVSIRGTTGRVTRVPVQLSGSNITQDTARITVNCEVSPDYVELYLRSPSAQQRLQRATKGAAVQGVNIGDVRALRVGVPPLSEQLEIVRRTRLLFDIANSVEARVAQVATRADKLTQGALSKAFRGELVPTEAELARRDGREYEPAWKLLDRVRAKKADEAAGTRGLSSGPSIRNQSALFERGDYMADGSIKTGDRL